MRNQKRVNKPVSNKQSVEVAECVTSQSNSRRKRPLPLDAAEQQSHQNKVNKQAETK